jgi:methylisocitrate lyase
VEGFDSAVSRARLYLQAGADALFPEALESEEEFAAFARVFPGVPLLANMTEFGRSPLLDRATLAQLGFRLVLYPVTGFRAALGAARNVLLDVLTRGGQSDHLGEMLTRRELYDLLDYEGYEARDRSYFG